MAGSGPRRRLVVEADGGSRGNPGVAGYGALVRDGATGRLLAERAAPLGRRSNNVAEYRALIAGLEAALAVDPGADVEVRMDSRLVIEQMAGRWKIKHEDMRRLALEARDLVRQVEAAGGQVTWVWVPREQNAAADRLSNIGMDGRTVARTFLDDGAAGSRDVRPGPGVCGQADAEQASGGRAGPTASMRVLLVCPPGAGSRPSSGAVGPRGRDPGLDPGLDAEERRAVEAIARAVRELGGAHVKVVTSSEPAAVETGAMLAAYLETEAHLDTDWDLGALPGLHGPPASDARRQVRAALARAGRTGTAAVVAGRPAILLVLADALGIAPERVGALGADPGSLTAVEIFADGRASVPFTNRTAHLESRAL